MTEEWMCANLETSYGLLAIGTNGELLRIRGHLITPIEMRLTPCSAQDQEMAKLEFNAALDDNDTRQMQAVERKMDGLVEKLKSGLGQGKEQDA